MAGERGERTLARFRVLYREADRKRRSEILNEFCLLTGYHRKYAITVLRQVSKVRRRRKRPAVYGIEVIRILTTIWEAAGNPWSTRLKAIVPIWLPWIRGKFPGLDPETERLLLKISARQIDRCLLQRRRSIRRRLYGRTKPGTLLKHSIPIKTDNWDVTEPGHVEIDLVAHCGPCASGEFVHSLNLTDIMTGWSATRAVLGRGEKAVVEALDDIRRDLPFPLKCIDSDNGSEFINHHLWKYCQRHGIRFVRGRPYKKDDNAHIEQKNWTHVRRVFGYVRYDTPEAVEAMNALYAGELQWMMNLFQPSVKLITKTRVGARVRRTYDKPRTPLDRLLEHDASHHREYVMNTMIERRARTNPFELALSIERSLLRIGTLSHTEPARGPKTTGPTPTPRTRAAA